MEGVSRWEAGWVWQSAAEHGYWLAPGWLLVEQEPGVLELPAQQWSLPLKVSSLPSRR